MTGKKECMSERKCVNVFLACAETSAEEKQKELCMIGSQKSIKQQQQQNLHSHKRTNGTNGPQNQKSLCLPLEFSIFKANLLLEFNPIRVGYCVPLLTSYIASSSEGF